MATDAVRSLITEAKLAMRGLDKPLLEIMGQYGAEHFGFPYNDEGIFAFSEAHPREHAFAERLWHGRDSLGIYFGSMERVSAKFGAKIDIDQAQSFKEVATGRQALLKDLFEEFPEFCYRDGKLLEPYQAIMDTWVACEAVADRAIQRISAQGEGRF